MTTPEIPYNRKAVDPVECIKAGWELVKPQYWLFVGMSAYERVFGLAHAREDSNLPPPPPTFE